MTSDPEYQHHFSGTKKKLDYAQWAYKRFKTVPKSFRHNCPLMGMILGLSVEKYRLEYLGPFEEMEKFEIETGLNLLSVEESDKIPVLSPRAEAIRKEFHEKTQKMKKSLGEEMRPDPTDPNTPPPEHDFEPPDKEEYSSRKKK